jgi:enterochelin esterase-like enzyme
VLKRWIAYALIVALSLSWGGVAPALAGELQQRTVRSPALDRDMPYTVYLPDGYRSGDLHYPVLYLLHGAGGDESAWVEHGGIRERADRLIASGAIPPTLIVMPGCRACWWIDGARDQAETAFWSDLVPSVAANYRTIETRAGRLVAGLSAGGYGAIRFAMTHPDRIAAIAALSPAIYATTPPANSSARSQPPFLDATGSFSQASWTAHNYPSLTDRYFTQKQHAPFYLVSGDRDGFGIAFETALLFKVMFGQQPEAAKLRIVDGDHNWLVWANALDEAMVYMYGFAARPERRAPAVATPEMALLAKRR